MAHDEPDLEGLVSQLLGNSGGEDAASSEDVPSIGDMLKQQQEKTKSKFRAEGALFRRVFVENDDGRKILELMLDTTLRDPAWPIFDVQSMEMLTAMGIWNEAQRRFVHLIIEMIALGEQQEDDDDE